MMVAPRLDNKTLLDRLRTMERAREIPNEDNYPRLFRRFEVRGSALLHPMNRKQLDVTSLEVTLRDISHGGVGFICSRPLAANSIWRLELQLADYAIGYQAMVVRRVGSVGNGVYLCGASFIIDTALMALLGIDPLQLNQCDLQTEVDLDDGDCFVAPDEIL